MALVDGCACPLVSDGVDVPRERNLSGFKVSGWYQTGFPEERVIALGSEKPACTFGSVPK